MVDNPNGTDVLSMNDALSLLSNPPADTAAEENEAQEEPQQPEAEALDAATDNADEAPDDDIDDDDAGEGEDDYDDDEYEEVVEEPQQKYEVKIDGETVEVDLDELRNGYQRQQSFTRKSMELAEQRKAFEQEAAETKQLRDAYAQQLDLLSAQIQQTVQQEPDWRALAETMSERDLFLAKTEWDQYKEQQKTVEAERQRVAEQQMQDHQRNGFEHFAPKPVAVSVVALLEIVHVGDDQRQRLLGPRGPRPFSFQRVLEGAAIGDAGEVVVGRKMLIGEPAQYRGVGSTIDPPRQQIHDQEIQRCDETDGPGRHIGLLHQVQYQRRHRGYKKQRVGEPMIGIGGDRRCAHGDDRNGEKEVMAELSGQIEQMARRSP